MNGAWLPDFYLYRHALELGLKAVVQPRKLHHGLRPLIEAFDELLRLRGHPGIPVHLREDLLTFADIDPDAQGFRYSHTTRGKAQVLPGEYWVQLSELKDLMTESLRFIWEAARRLAR